MFATDLKILTLTTNDVKSENNSPMIRYQKQQNLSQKYQNNNVIHHHNNNNNNNSNNRKKVPKVPVVNSNNNANKNHHNTNSQSYATNNHNHNHNRKKLNNHQLNNNTCTTKSNSNMIKNQNTHTPTSGGSNANIVIKNNTNNLCSDRDQIVVPKSRCDSLVSKNIASDLISTSTFQKPSTSSNSLVSSSSSLSSSSSSLSSSTNIGNNSSFNNNSNNNNKGRVAIRFGTTVSNHQRKKSQQIEEDINSKKSPIPIMVVSTSGGSNNNYQQLPAVFTAPICTTSSAPSSAPVSPSSYSLDFLHSVGVQMAGGADPRHLGNNHHHHVYSNSATVSPARSAHNMIVQGQRIIYQDIPPPEKRTLLLDHTQHKYSPKVHSPTYSDYQSYDIPILINQNHHPGGDCFSSPYNYPPLNNNYKRNSFIPVSYPYQKSHNEGYASGNNTPNQTYNRNRNQSKAWNNGNANAHKNASNGMPKHNGEYANSNSNSQNMNRVKNHQNIRNLTYVTTDSNNNKYLDGSSRSQSSSPKSENPVAINNKATNKSECPPPVNTLTQIPGKGETLNAVDIAHYRVASEGYESDSSNSSCGKKANAGHRNFLSSSSSSISSTEIPYQPPSSIGFNFPTSFTEEDVMQTFYGSEHNLAHLLPALHAQFMCSAHGIYPQNENSTEFQQQQHQHQQHQHHKKSQTHRSSYRGGRDRFLARSHLVEIKEVPRTLLTCSKWDNLSQGIWNKFINAQQTEDTFKRKMKLWRYLYIIVKNAYPRLGLYLVGSTMSGFGADTSDIDMCLVSRAMSNIDPRMEALFNLTLLRDCLIKTGEFEKFNLIGAKVPILRFKDRVHNLEVDLNFNNCVGIRNTHLLFCYSQLDWRLRPLVLVIKLWAQYHNINNAKNMTISSYSLVLMVIHFLQCAVSPPVLPCLHEMYPDKFTLIHRSNDFGHVDMNETMAPYDSQNTQPIGQLFLQFLQYYSNFNYSQFAISIRTGALIPVEYCRQAKSLKNDIHQWKELCIEEPFDLTNTARSVYDYDTFERVKLVFITSYRVLQETLDINSIFTPLVPVWPVQEN
ncbi:putative uncharacterized protein DDB_G0289263 [Eupeodes corollae]|uniref:putative uncharacterized protein DDB_G0289263 n=1 Tax=Eupeodes corollae TaxID=290404 RepID=UPI002491940A|nr:putative uncharacterized protein DDB_G0289263 [Eupeodes corollae]XP_055909669.1 putative uncharacterized protein DDB_G0289263 [Eupeodes corollae]